MERWNFGSVRRLAASARIRTDFRTSQASIKVLTIVGLIILGLILDAGGGPNRDPIGFRYWRNPGPFIQYLGIEGAQGRFLGLWVPSLVIPRRRPLLTPFPPAGCPDPGRILVHRYRNRRDCCWRSEEPQTKPPKGHSEGVGSVSCSLGTSNHR